MSLYLVSGGLGFIGSNIVHRLLDDGKEVRVIDNLATGRKSNIASVIEEFELLEGDIRDYSAVERSMESVDYVLHQAALPSVARSIINPYESNEVNVLGTLNLLKAAHEADIKQFVYASSSSVYGDTPTLPKVENMPVNPKSFYSVSKYAAEQQCIIYNQINGLNTVCLRYFNVYGPRQDPSSQYAAVIPKFITSIAKDESPTVFGDGTQSRDFTFIEDAVLANLKAAKSSKGVGEVCNIAVGQRRTVNELIGLVNELLEKNIDAEYAKPRPGDVKHSHADISKAQRLLGYKPEHDLKKGLEKTVEWFRDSKFQ
ncbi:MAG: SDR family oxidoreductase [Candidatus Altiarchaeota archaeon]